MDTRTVAASDGSRGMAGMLTSGRGVGRPAEY